MGCAYIHGDICDYCGQASLHPTHLDQRRAVRRADRDGGERDGQLVLPPDFVELLQLTLTRRRSLQTRETTTSN